jgi:nucleoside phosphorylase
MAPTLKLEELLHAKDGSRSSSIRLLKKDRLILAKSITRSLFYLIGSPLLSEVWKTEAIYVAQPHDPRTDIYKPYVVREITKEMMLKEVGGSAFVLHLAVILWELLFGRRIVILPEDEEDDGEDENISLFNALGREECDLRESCIEKPFLDIIANCLDLYPENELDDQELRSKVYWNILKPLQSYVEAYQPDIPAASAYHTASRLAQKYEDKTKGESSRTRTPLRGPSASHDPYPSTRRKMHFINKGMAYCGDAHKLHWEPRNLHSLPEESEPDINGRFEPHKLSQMLLSEATSTWSQRRLKHDDYKIGIVCALAKEHLAVRSLFDDKHQHLEIPLGDTNQYALGRLAHHNVVTACLPAGNYGTSPAAQIMTNMKRTFTSVEHYLLVGIGGGVPTKENDLRLGDVVVSLPEGGFPGVIQYDRGKDVENGEFEQTGALPPPPHALLNVISDLRSDPDLPPDPLQPHIERISNLRPEYGHPGAGKDKLLQAEAVSPNGSTHKSDGWHNSHTVEIRNQPKIHYGLIASGNRVIKNAASRDRLGQRYNVICIEMEAAGIANVTQCLVIRGICDYADSDKNKVWQEYASATAAAYAKLLLSHLRCQA